MNPAKTLTTLTPVKLWFYLSLTLAITCGILGIIPALSHQYIVQDDARSHIFWMAKFLNPELFPNDIIADYFQSVAPQGYTHLYKLFSLIKIPPLLLNKILPIILGLITTAYCFKVAIQILPIPLAGFLSTLFLNQNLWLKDDLISGTPRAFFYPLFLGFLHYFLKKSSLGIIITITLLGLFYPQGVFLSAALLTLDFLHLPNQQKLTILTIGLTTAFLILLPYALNTSEYSPIITLTQAKKLPEFFPGGRASFFSNNNFDFWLTGDRSGIIPPEWLSQSFLPPQVWAGLLLFIFLSFNKKNITQKITNKIILLPELALASTGIFIAAHLLLFRLHHPSRYSQHSLRIIMALAGGIAFTLIIELIRKKLHLLNNSSKNQPLQKIRAISISTSIYIVLTLIIIYPALTNNFPVTNYVVGKAPQLYEYLAQQPSDIRIASLALEANNIPTFAKRSILVSSEYALPYHQGYYNQIKQRAKDLIQAQYSPNLEEVKKIIHKYKIDFWLLDSQALTLEYVRKNHRLQQLNYTAANLVKSQMENGITPTLLNVPEKCRVLDIHNLVLLEAKCILGVTSSN
ncbi:hypothetical protein Tery_2631 [Trichodesmium erythraeum IMS101]|uniref:Glycosyltransferase RgtA/B/C/D-like domain-containing protein n=1 Tax=Trichodesmium erythraeum (strain IMS101) TaxID=203124 RepID=Q111J8_TRIEI|nr:hypothetical protein [Trichodesmium erythraeum GBRTRLIN201]MCH2047674.1 hypothetical protein [Trichodesmium sp. ALOHA_ZT_67]